MNQERTARRPVPLFYRILHASYWRGTRLSQFINSRITPIGWVLLGVFGLAAVLGADVQNSKLYQVFSVGFAVLAVSLLWAWARRVRLRARRALPRHATAGEECRYTIEVRNEGKSTARGFLLWDCPPDPRPAMRSFAFTQEPGEKERNAFDRLFVYYRWRWLLDRRLLFKGGLADEVVVLRAGESARVRVSFEARRRGVIKFSDMRARLPDPFGLFQRCRRVEADPDTIIVLPKRYRLPEIELPGEACFQLGGEATSNSIGQSSEFLGLREYRAGDALRHIHWKSWAKTGVPIVKEFEDVYFPRYGLVLDNFAEHGDEDLFEESVSVAASFASAIDTKRSLLDLMFIRDEAIVVTAGRGVARAEKLMEVLAAVEAEPEEHLEALERLVQRHRLDLTACICVFTGWSAERADFLRNIAATGLEMMALVLCRNAEETRAQAEEHPIPCRHLLLEAGKVQEGLLKL